MRIRLDILSNGDDPVYIYPRSIDGLTLLVRVRETADYDREWSEMAGKYLVEVLAVDPDGIDPERGLDAAQSIGMKWEDMSREARSEALAIYGCAADLYCDTSDDLRHLMIGARNAIRNAIDDIYPMLNRPQNRMGSTGFDFMRGDV